MESTDKSIGRAVLLIVISALSFGSISVLTVLVTREKVPLITAMAWRYLLAGICLGFLIRPCGSRSITPQPERTLESWPAKSLVNVLQAAFEDKTLTDAEMEELANTIVAIEELWRETFPPTLRISK